MVVLKVNELQWNSNGLTVKTSKQQVKIWRRNVDAHYASLNHTIVTKELCNNGKQHTYILNGNKYTFEYYITGRIVVKTNNVEQLRNTFVNNHESILGVRLDIVGSAGKPQQSLVARRNLCPGGGNVSKSLIPTINTATSSQPSQHGNPAVQADEASTQQVLLTPELNAFQEQKYKKQEDDINGLRSELTELKEEMNRLKKDIKALETNQQPQVKVESGPNRPTINSVYVGSDHPIAEDKSIWKKIESMEKKKLATPIHGLCTNLAKLGGTQVRSVKYLAEQYQRMSTPKNPRNK